LSLLHHLQNASKTTASGTLLNSVLQWYQSLLQSW